MNRWQPSLTDADGLRSEPWNGHLTGAQPDPFVGGSPP